VARRRYKITKKTPLWLVGVIIFVTIGQQFGWFGSAGKTVVENQPGLYHVVKFDDGDTIAVDMNGKSETIRFIGVDTPETHDPRKAVQCFGQAAAAFTKQFIGDKSVRLEADPLNTNRDRYGRLLRYVYLPDGTLVNAELIKQGYAFAYLSFPFTKSDEFRTYQTDAREGNRGLWNSCNPQKNDFGGYTSPDAN
jgi:micrococcal nuclease